MESQIILNPLGRTPACLVSAVSTVEADNFVAHALSLLLLLRLRMPSRCLGGCVEGDHVDARDKVPGALLLACSSRRSRCRVSVRSI